MQRYCLARERLYHQTVALDCVWLSHRTMACFVAPIYIHTYLAGYTPPSRCLLKEYGTLDSVGLRSKCRGFSSTYSSPWKRVLTPNVINKRSIRDSLSYTSVADYKCNFNNPDVIGPRYPDFNKIMQNNGQYAVQERALPGWRRTWNNWGKPWNRVRTNLGNTVKCGKLVRGITPCNHGVAYTWLYRSGQTRQWNISEEAKWNDCALLS